MRRVKRGLSAACFAMLFAAFGTQAADYPTDSVRLAIPYTPGGGADTLGRLVADQAASKLGQTIVVENRPGANTMLATNYVANAKNDGYTLLYTSSSFTINPHVYKTQYDPIADFEPVALLSEIPLIMVTTPDSPIQSVADLQKAAKEAPGKISYSSYGLGSAAHLAGALFESMAGVELLHVPYKGSAPALNDLIGKHVDIAVVSLEPARELIASGKIRALGIFNKDRLRSMPDIPTVNETIPGCVTVGWNGIVAPRGTAPEIIETLNDAFNHALLSERLGQYFDGIGLDANPQSAQALADMIVSDTDRWSKLVKETNLKIE